MYFLSLSLSLSWYSGFLGLCLNLSWHSGSKQLFIILDSKICCVLNVVIFLLGDSTAS